MTPQAMEKVCKALAVLLFVIGGVGCILCLPYAFGTNIAWVTATGVYFIAGGIIMSGSLVSYALLTKRV